MIRKMPIAVLAAAALLTAVSCSAAVKTDSKESAGVEMTQEQKELLKKISMDEESIENGELDNWQKEVLNQYNFVCEYLGRKYPSHEFRIVDCAQKNKLNSYSTFWITADGKEEQYEVYLDVEDSGYTGSDSFYGTLIEEDYAKLVCDFLSEDIPGCIGCITSVRSSVGEELTEQVTAKDVFEGDYEVANSTEIYVDGRNADPEALGQQVQTKLTDKNLYGSYEVYVLKQEIAGAGTEEERMAYMRKADADKVYSILFHCFD